MDSYRERIKEIDRILSEEELPSLDRAFLEYLRFANESIGWSEEICRNIDKVVEEMSKLPINDKDMEEKKTKKMTKVEAYVYLNDTKVYVNGKGDKVLEVLSKVGFEPTFPQSDVNAFPFMLISDKQVTYYGHMKQYLGLPQKEISVDDILSIEIVEDEPLDKWDDFARCVAKVQEKIEEDEVCIITKGNFLTMTK